MAVSGYYACDGMQRHWDGETPEEWSEVNHTLLSDEHGRIVFELQEVNSTLCFDAETDEPNGRGEEIRSGQFTASEVLRYAAKSLQLPRADLLKLGSAVRDAVEGSVIAPVDWDLLNRKVFWDILQERGRTQWFDCYEPPACPHCGRR